MRTHRELSQDVQRPCVLSRRSPCWTGYTVILGVEGRAHNTYATCLGNVGNRGKVIYTANTTAITSDVALKDTTGTRHKPQIYRKRCCIEIHPTVSEIRRINKSRQYREHFRVCSWKGHVHQIFSAFLHNAHVHEVGAYTHSTNIPRMQPAAYRNATYPLYLVHFWCVCCGSVGSCTSSRLDVKGSQTTQ